MKRSEMIEILLKAFDKDLGYCADQIEADHILSVVEVTGMIPPPRFVNQEETCEWEPEEEE